MDRNQITTFECSINPVALHRSAWIEIIGLTAPALLAAVALHRSAWIEIIGLTAPALLAAVALHRSAWIEISRLPFF